MAADADLAEVMELAAAALRNAGWKAWVMYRDGGPVALDHNAPADVFRDAVGIASELIRRRRRRNPRSPARFVHRRNPLKPWHEAALWGTGLGLLALVVWKREEIVNVAKDLITRGTRLTTAEAGDNGLVMIAPEQLRTLASVVMGREIAQEVYDLARMIRSEGAAAGNIRAHVALNDAADLSWTLHQLLTYSTNTFVRGWYGEQFTPAARAPGEVKSVRRYATSKDPHAGDVLTAELAIAEHAQGVDPSGGAVKFVDKASLGSQEGARSYEDIVAAWGADGLRPFTLPGYSADLVVFRRA